MFLGRQGNDKNLLFGKLSIRKGGSRVKEKGRPVITYGINYLRWKAQQ